MEMVQWGPRKKGGENRLMARTKRPIRSAVLFFLRTLLGVERNDLAEAARLKESTIADFERGKNEPGLPALECLASALGVSEVLLEEVLALAEGVGREGATSDVWVGPILVSAARMRNAREFGEEMGRVARDGFSGWVLQDWVEAEAARERATASDIGFYLCGREDLREVVREDPGCHLWSVAEWLADESLRTISRNPERAAELAEAALVVAELVPGDERFRRRLEGFAWAHLGNVHRAGGDLKQADAAFSRSIASWAAGAGGDPYRFLDAGRVWGMEASLRMHQDRFPEALLLIHEALAEATYKERPYLLLTHAKILEEMESYDQALKVLRQAAAIIPPHLGFPNRFNILVNLCNLDRHEEAESLMPELLEEGLTFATGSDQVRLRWLQGRIAAGRGQTAEALDHLWAVRAEFLERGNPYDTATVSLELARIYLEEGRTGAVKNLAAESAPIFASQDLHAQAQAALRLFQEAAEQEAASVELVVRIVKYLQRARRSPELRFDALA
jgi:tetratricopeptide (TPR) repeat protein/DNA-binding XRE family transcriptional regulator